LAINNNIHLQANEVKQEQFLKIIHVHDRTMYYSKLVLVHLIIFVFASTC